MVYPEKINISAATLQIKYVEGPITWVTAVFISTSNSYVPNLVLIIKYDYYID